MATLAIKGHTTRGKEVIALLEMLGGRNTYNYSANCDNLCFYISTGTNIICSDWVNNCYGDEDILVFTLEEFEEKYPYKVGDKVIIKINNQEAIIDKVVWCCGTIIYWLKYDDCLEGNWRTEHLQPYKEETMEERQYKELRMPLDDEDKLATEVTIDGDKILPPNGYLIGKITQVDNGMLVEYVKQQPQYPKTYNECCKVLFPNTIELGKVSTHGYNGKLLEKFGELLICRDAYWKIEEGWKEKRRERAIHYVICSTLLGEVIKDTMPNCIANYLLDFPTEEMRNAFFENFKDLIEECKELL